VSDYSYTRYLAAKKTVDDRALNQPVFARLRRELGSRPQGRRLVLEVGAGLGTMVARLIDWQLIAEADYLLVDVDTQLLADSRAWLTRWAGQCGLAIDATQDHLHLYGGALDWTIRFIPSELGAFLANEANRVRADLIIANAFLDLVDVGVMLPQLFRLLVPDGLYWFTINFDGESIFEPAHHDDADFMRVYHRSMDERIRYGRPAGDSRTGRHLFHRLRDAGARILAAGASDWVVFADAGRYAADEAHFAHHIIHTVDEELQRHAEIDRARLAEWVALRHRQIDRGELVYVAHQIDFCGRGPGR
jgi:hypothetical protein